MSLKIISKDIRGTWVARWVKLPTHDWNDLRPWSHGSWSEAREGFCTQWRVCLSFFLYSSPCLSALSISKKKINKSLKKIKISDLLFGCKSTWSFGGNKIECVELDYGGSWWFQWVLTHSRKGRKGGIIVLTENNPMKLTWLSDSANNILYLH